MDKHAYMMGYMSGMDKIARVSPDLFASSALGYGMRDAGKSIAPRIAEVKATGDQVGEVGKGIWDVISDPRKAIEGAVGYGVREGLKSFAPYAVPAALGATAIGGLGLMMMGGGATQKRKKALAARQPLVDNLGLSPIQGVGAELNYNGTQR